MNVLGLHYVTRGGDRTKLDDIIKRAAEKAGLAPSQFR